MSPEELAQAVADLREMLQDADETTRERVVKIAVDGVLAGSVNSDVLAAIAREAEAMSREVRA